MRFLVFLSSLCVFLHSIFQVSSTAANDGNLFADSDSDPLFPNSPSLLSGDTGDAALEPSPLLGDPISTDLDWTDQTDPFDLAGSGGLCTVVEEVQYTGRMRARGNANSCSSSDQTTNLLQLPGPSDLDNIINGMMKKPKAKPGESADPLPVFLAPSPENDNPCVPPWPRHLCCLYPEYETVIEFGLRVYTVARECSPSM